MDVSPRAFYRMISVTSSIRHPSTLEYTLCPPLQPFASPPHGTSHSLTESFVKPPARHAVVVIVWLQSITGHWFPSHNFSLQLASRNSISTKIRNLSRLSEYWQNLMNLRLYSAKQRETFLRSSATNRWINTLFNHFFRLSSLMPLSILRYDTAWLMVA